VPDFTIEPPTDPKALRNYRLALGAVIILTVLIVIAITALIVGFARGGDKTPPPAVVTTAPAKPAKPAGKPVSMTLAPGYKILSSETQPGRLILHVRSDSQDEIDIVDLEDGHIISQIHASAPQ
jgi:hypothetical protein